MGIPTRLWPTATSGTLGLRGRLGLARDAVLPRPDLRGPMGDRSVGPLVARKLGRDVVDSLVDPMMGGIHAGSVEDMSAAAVYPPLLAAAQRRGGLMRALRAEVEASAPAASGPGPTEGTPPLFWALQGGMATLVEAMAGGLRARGVDIRLGTAAEHLGHQGGRWTVATAAACPRSRRRRAGHAPRPSPPRCSASTTRRRRRCSRGSTTPRSSSSPSASASTTFRQRKAPVSSCLAVDGTRAAVTGGP